MGRPTFIICKKRLRALREEAGKTQLAIAKELHAKLGKKHPSVDATLERDYQRIERNGRTSRGRANALAEIFGVTVEVLQGKDDPEPFDYIAGIAAHLREQFSSGASEALLRVHKKCANKEEPTEEIITGLAEDIGARIEAVQLRRNSHEIAELAQLLGWSESEILKPANVGGHWLVIASGLGIHRTELFRGTGGLLSQVKDIVGGKLDVFGSDSSIRMIRDDPWIRLEMQDCMHPNHVIRIDFVRCRPSDTGINWIKASWRELHSIEPSIKNWAYSAANVVTDFDGKQSPGDIRRLRFLVTEHAGTGRATGRMLISGNFDELPEERLDSYRRQNEAHFQAQRRLAGNLKCALTPFLAEYPRECWSIYSSDQITIFLDEYKAKKRQILECHLGVKYCIRFVEENAKNIFDPVPWRKIDIQSLQAEIQKMLDDPNDRSWATDEPRRKFEPYAAEK